MPHITPEDRVLLNDFGYISDVAGELNYEITKLIIQYLSNREGGFRYQHLNDVTGALENAKQEFVRLVVIPYENKKIAENGNVYQKFLEENKLV
jgi:hypothetical protein